MLSDEKRKLIDDATKELNEKGMLIEAGFASLVVYCDLIHAPPDQLREMRMAFFAGAQHLFGSIMSLLDPEADVTEKDLERLGLIEAELQKFINEYMAQNVPTVGGRQ